MAKLEPTTVERAIKKWAIRHKEKGYTPAELTILAMEYYEDLIEEGFTEDLFKAASKLARRRTDFFPTMRLLIECKEDAIKQRNREVETKKHLALPEYTRGEETEEEKIKEAQRLTIIKEAMDTGNFAAATKRLQDLYSNSSSVGKEVDNERNAETDQFGSHTKHPKKSHRV